MDKRSSRDLLSNLPLNIIHTILELVPIRDAVKTCILSRQWRYTWATLPRLVFDGHLISSENFSIKDFISQVLSLHQGPIIEFKLHVPFAEVHKNINQWLIILSNNGIRKLILDFYGDDSFQVDSSSSMYSCQNLTHLEIYNCEFPTPPPTFKGFLFLRCLVLDEVDMSSDTFQSLFANLSLLEELRLDDCMYNSSLVIRAPNLKILHLSGLFSDLCLSAPLLVKMSAIFFNDLPYKESSVSNYIKVLCDLTSLEELKANLNFFKYLSMGIESCCKSVVFPHLRFIELNPEAFYDTKVVSVVARLSMSAPNLRKIRVSDSYSCGLELESEGLSLDTECPVDFTFEQLKVIELRNVGNGNHWMSLIKCLLARSPVLDTLICEPDPTLTDGELLKQTTTLLAYPRASSAAKISFKKS